MDKMPGVFNQKPGRYTFNEFNHDPKIKLVDKENNLIQMINQIEAFHLLRTGICELLLVIPPILQFQLERNEWQTGFLKFKLPKWFREKVRWHEARKSVLYGNFRIQSPEGFEMFHCNSQKALWYLNRDLADIIAENPPTLRLKFIPGGPGHIGDEYYLTGKVNRCVVCGDVKYLTRHHVMPRVFRRYLPESIKDHNYHDVLLMCIECHEKYEVEGGKLKQKIAKEFDVSLNDGGGVIYIHEVGKAVKAANALLYHGEKIPEPRKTNLLNIVKDYLKKQEIIQDDLEEVSRHSIWLAKGERYKSYGQCVIEKIGDIQEFTQLWRQHFLEVMDPKFMPAHWDVYKPLVSDRIRTPNGHGNAYLSEEAQKNVAEAN